MIETIKNLSSYFNQEKENPSLYINPDLQKKIFNIQRLVKKKRCYIYKKYRFSICVWSF